MKARSKYKIIQAILQVMVEARGVGYGRKWASKRTEDDNSLLKARIASLFFAAEIGRIRFRLSRNVLVLLKHCNEGSFR